MSSDRSSLVDVITSMAISPYVCASAIKLQIELREERPIVKVSASNPASFIIFAAACAFYCGMKLRKSPVPFLFLL